LKRKITENEDTFRKVYFIIRERDIKKESNV